LGDEFYQACHLKEKHMEDGTAAADAAIEALLHQLGFLVVIGGCQCRACRARGTPCKLTAATLRYMGGTDF
jgi:hypothetical protein